MKKLFYLPALVFVVHSIISFFGAGYNMFWTKDYGKASLYIIFVFTGMIAATFMYALAQD